MPSNSLSNPSTVCNTDVIFISHTRPATLDAYRTFLTPEDPEGNLFARNQFSLAMRETRPFLCRVYVSVSLLVNNFLLQRIWVLVRVVAFGGKE